MFRPRSAIEESERLATLRRFGILDAPPDGVLDRITALAATLFGVPIALVTLLDETRQTLHSRYGLDLPVMPREFSFCDHTIREDGVMIVPDALEDARFRDNPYVLDLPKIRFYAGAPLVAGDGSKLGAVCIIDTVPRTLDPLQIRLLEQLSALVIERFELHAENRDAAAARNKLQAIIEASPSGIVTTRLDGTVTTWNDAAQALFGWSREEIVGQVPSLPEASRTFGAQLQRQLARGENVHDLHGVFARKDGVQIDVEISGGPVRDPHGEIVEGVFLIDDVTDAVRARAVELNRYEILGMAAHGTSLAELLDRLVANVELALPNCVAAIARYGNGSARRVASGARMPPGYLAAIEGISTAAYFQASPRTVMRGETFVDADIVADIAWGPRREEAIANGLRAAYTTPIRSATLGTVGVLVAYAREPRKPNERELLALAEAAHVAAITIESDDAREKLHDMALHDSLTDLPNRTLFESRLHAAIDVAKRTSRRVGIGMLDLDRFKLINDNLGHAIGDQLLQEVANRLQSSIRVQDTVARMGGDEFLILLTDLRDRDGATAIAERCLGSLAESFAPGGHELFVRGSLGISIFPDDAAEPSQLLRLADHAMYQAKATGGGVAFHDAERATDGLTQLALETYLNLALEKDEFELVYQPIVRCASGESFGIEALLRWNHPTLGRVAPATFIELAEETGLIIPIGKWILHEACRFAQRWSRSGGSGIIAVNVSPRQFEDRGFVETVVEALRESGLPPEHLYLEITEGLIMRSPASVAATLADLRKLGVRSVIDDFGTGYSSLNYLKRFPIDMLKIDRSFVAEVGSAAGASSDEAIVRAVVAIGAALGLAIVAEGVETVAQADFVRAAGCQFVQGFLFSPPLSADALLSAAGS